MSQDKLIQEKINELRTQIDFTFGHLNDYKRHRAHKQSAIIKSDDNRRQYHELKEYQLFDQLELNIRSIQRTIREMEGDKK